LDEGLKIRQAPFRKGQISWAKTIKNPWNGSVLLGTSMGNHHFEENRHDFSCRVSPTGRVVVPFFSGT